MTEPAGNLTGHVLEQAGEQGDQGRADEGHTAPGHELLHALGLY